MHPEGFKPLTDAMKGPGNIVLAALAVGFGADLIAGGPVVMKLFGMVLHQMHIDPSTQHVRIVTMFGEFSDVHAGATFLEKAAVVVFGFFPALSWLRGLYAALTGK